MKLDASVYTIHLAKEPFKFSCSHFTILSSTHAERLHGHNYQVRVGILVDQLDPQLGLAFDFNSVKPFIRELCDNLDERILLPAKSPFLHVREVEKQIEVGFADKHYSFPSEDTRQLSLVNITSEELARHICLALLKSMQSLKFWTELEVNVEETRGQSVSFRQKR